MLNSCKYSNMICEHKPSSKYPKTMMIESLSQDKYKEGSNIMYHSNSCHTIVAICRLPANWDERLEWWLAKMYACVYFSEG